ALLLPDGKLLVVGRAIGQGVLLARYEANGTPDASFGVGGIVFDAAITLDLLDAVLDPSGAVTAAGLTDIARYDSNGAPDPTFGVGGRIALTSIQATYAIARQPDGFVVVGGKNDGHAWLTRLDGSGAADVSFGTVGQVINPSVGDRFERVLLQPDGR